jgi:hypothetical protein
VGAGAGFGVILNTEDGEIAMAKALDGVVVKIQMGDNAAFGFE